MDLTRPWRGMSVSEVEHEGRRGSYPGVVELGLDADHFSFSFILGS